MKASLRSVLAVKRGGGIGTQLAMEGDGRQGGQMLVLFTLVLVLILVAASIVIDLGLLRNDRQSLVNAMDAGALAGGTLMPVDGSQSGEAAKVNTLVDQTVQATYPGLSNPSDYQITYRCLIGTEAGNPGAFDAADIAKFIPLDCNPSQAVGPSLDLGDFIGAGRTRSSDCRPDLGDRCNVVVVEGNVTTPYSFGRVVGVNSGETGAVQSAACKGLCGELPPEFDVELVMDTSGSMQSNISNGQTRIYWARLAANQLVTDLNNNGGIGATGHRVGITRFSGEYTSPTAATALGGWSLDAAGVSGLINGLSAAGKTPLQTGMSTGAADLTTNARNAVGGTVKRVLILLSDGRPNPDLGPNSQPATIAAGNERPTQTEITSYLGSADIAYSIMIGTTPPSLPIGAVTSPPNTLNSNIVDPNLMKMLATPDDLSATPPKKYFFNVVDASGLPDVFRQIAIQLLDPHSRLISLHPAPIVTGVSPTSATGSPVTITITGQFFTGTTVVRFGSNPATTFTVNSDTSITATGVAGSANTTVDIVVTTPGGSSPVVSGDQFTYLP